jgi:methyl-accepting chemotaxis protein
MVWISRFLWSAFFRVPAFWVLVAGVVAAADYWFDWIDVIAVYRTIGDALHSGSIEAVTQPNFAFSLAGLLFFFGLGLTCAFIVMHAIAVGLTMWRARRAVSRYKDRQVFSANYEKIYEKLTRHRLIGHAWKEFDETLLRPDQPGADAIGNTVRPQSFINYALARERLPGLKMLGGISGYFVGAGLLLTFVGIVLALNIAAKSIDSKDAAAMQMAMGELLHTASFKFATSIAGLGVSLVFSLAAKLVTVSLESSFAKFNAAVEERLRYTAPQSIAAAMKEIATEQRDQLKEMNSDRYFTKLADSIAPLLEQAMTNAMSPVTQSIGDAVAELRTTSQSSVGDLIERFSSSLQGGAGAELRELGQSLRQMQATLADTNSRLQGTGEDFARRMSEAAENLNRLVGEAGNRLEGGAEQNRAALQEIVSALQLTFEKANRQLDSDLGAAAAGASSKVEEAMQHVMERLEGQIGAFVANLQEFQSASSSGIADTKALVTAAQSEASAAVGIAASEAARALQAGLADTMARISAEIDRLESAMRSTVTAYASQASAIGEVATETRGMAGSFAQTAEQVRGAAAPLLATSERMSQASSDMNQAITRGVTELAKASATSSELSANIAAQIDRLEMIWESHRQQFDKVDEMLAEAVGRLRAGTVEHVEQLVNHVRILDGELATVVGTLQSNLADIGESATELSESVEKLAQSYAPEPAE